MDCCNYMQYRSHQPYGFGPGYYDHLPDYNHGGDFYGQHLYHDYYNSHYYPQQWSQVPPFQDYVYNPKEARIRKAMREASRDRSIGASPMLPRPGSRHPPQHGDWAQPQEDPLMMSPMDSMRRMDTPICSYPITNTENNQYMSPMNAYSKIDSPSMMPNYMQPSPLAQLQQQTEMWHPYQDNMRPRSLGTPFHHTMMPDMQPPTYHSQEPVQETATNLIMDKTRQSPACSSQSLTETSASPHRIPEDHALTPPVAVPLPTNTQSEPQLQPQTNQQQHYLETRMSPERMQTSMMENNQQLENRYMPEPMMSCASFEPPPKAEPVVPVTKKPRGRPPTKKPQPAPHPPPKPLPDFNEAFGSTERGRFLSPPDPRLNKSYLDVLFDNDNSFMKFDNFQI